MKYKSLIILFFAFSLGSCSKSFLDQTPTDGVTVSSSITSDVDMYTAINGLYNDLESYHLYGRNLIIRGDLMSDNAFLATSNSGRYTNWNLYEVISTDSYIKEIWQYGYAAIKDANNIINSSIDTTTNINQLKGEAYAIRALLHFELVRNFAKPYLAGSSNLGVPIVTTFDQSSLPARNTISEVYTQIISDLKNAEDLVSYDIGSTMTFSSSTTRTMNSSEITKYSVYALEARVYQAMGDWENALTASLAIINNSGFSLATASNYASYWASTDYRTDKVETLFELSSDDNTNNGSNSLAGIYLTNALGGSYGDILMNQDLYSKYSSTDVRKNVITAATRSGQNNTTYFCLKYLSSTNSDTKVMRYADVVLIAAEAYYNLNNYTSANLYLNKVAQTRDLSVAAYTGSDATILENILTERQKEFAFEGVRFWDLYRLQRSFTKVKDELVADNLTVTSSTTNYVFPIPFSEISANPNITQNDGYTN